MTKKLEELIEKRIAWIDDFLRDFSDFLSTESLGRIGIYKQALNEVLTIIRELKPKKEKKE